MTDLRGIMLAEAWRCLGGPDDLLSSDEFTGPDGTLPSRLPVTPLAQATVGAASLAAAELLALRNGNLPLSTVDSVATAVAFVSERHLRLDDRALMTMDPLSRFLPAADGWVRLHGNYPHHRERLYHALGVPDGSSDPVAAVIRALAALPAAEVEQRVTAAGG